MSSQEQIWVGTNPDAWSVEQRLAYLRHRAAVLRNRIKNAPGWLTSVEAQIRELEAKAS